jgi:hypothetical protein
MSKRILLNAIPSASYVLVSIGMIYAEVQTWLYFAVSAAIVLTYFSGLFLGAMIKEEVES